MHQLIKLSSHYSFSLPKSTQILFHIFHTFYPLLINPILSLSLSSLHSRFSSQIFHIVSRVVFPLAFGGSGNAITLKLEAWSCPVETESNNRLDSHRDLIIDRWKGRDPCEHNIDLRTCRIPGRATCKGIPRTLTHGLAAVLNAVATLCPWLCSSSVQLYSASMDSVIEVSVPLHLAYLFAVSDLNGRPLRRTLAPTTGNNAKIVLHSNFSSHGRTPFSPLIFDHSIRGKEGRRGKKGRMGFCAREIEEGFGVEVRKLYLIRERVCCPFDNASFLSNFSGGKKIFLLIFDSRKGDEGKDRIEKCNVKGVKNCVPCIKEYPLICDNENLYKYVI